MKEQLELLPDYFSAHIRLVIIALSLSTLASVPLGVLATRSARLERIVVGIASVIQTIPALALLAVMVPILGAFGLPAIGVLPALVGLALYCALPILIATVTGVREVSPALIEAARGVGMTPKQVLRHVELPLAAPFIVAGLRTSAVWCVGMGTLSTPVGAPSLGNFIFGGLQTRNHYATLTGCVAAAVLALVLDTLVRLVETGLRKRKKPSLWIGSVGLGALVAYTIVSMTVGAIEDARSPKVRIGAKTYTEQYVLAQMIAQTVRQGGREPQIVESLGSSVVFDALAANDLDVYVDYTGTVWTTILKHPDPATDRAALLAQVESELAEKYGVTLVASLGFENTYALAMRKADADRLGVTKLSELTPHTRSLVFGADYEFFTRKEWADIKRVYGYEFKKNVSMDPALMYQAAAQKEVDIICAFSTDGRIASYDLTVLEDDRHTIPPYDAIILASKKMVSENPLIVDALRGLAGSIDAATMREMNRSVDEDKRTPADVAQSFLRSLSSGDGGAQRRSQ